MAMCRAFTCVLNNIVLVVEETADTFGVQTNSSKSREETIWQLNKIYGAARKNKSLLHPRFQKCLLSIVWCVKNNLTKHKMLAVLLRNVSLILFSVDSKLTCQKMLDCKHQARLDSYVVAGNDINGIDDMIDDLMQIENRWKGNLCGPW